MGVGEFLSSKAENEWILSERRRENWEMENCKLCCNAYQNGLCVHKMCLIYFTPSLPHIRSRGRDTRDDRYL